MFNFLNYLQKKGAMKYNLAKSELMKYQVAFWDCDFEEVDKIIQSGATGTAYVIEADPHPLAIEWLWSVQKQKSKIGVYYRKKCT